MKTTVTCKHCGATADLKGNIKAWNGWQVSPGEVCPDCIAKGLAVQEVQIRESHSMGKYIRVIHIVENPQ